MAERHAAIGHLVVLYPEHQAPRPEEREGIARVLRQFRAVNAGTAIVREGDGFKATLTRTVVSAIHLLSRATHPMHVFADVGEASVWLESHVARPAVDATAVRSAVRELRGDFV